MRKIEQKNRNPSELIKKNKQISKFEYSKSTTNKPLYKKQEEVAKRTLDAIMQNSSAVINECTDFDWFILMPYFRSLSDQMVNRVKEWIDLVRSKGKTEDVDYSNFLRNIQPNESRTYVMDHVIRLGTSGKDNSGKKF